MTRATRLSLWLWLGSAGGVLVAAAVVASLILIAPGVAVAGAPVGLVTQGIAEQDIGDRLAHAEIHVGDAVLSEAELGASVDAHALARHAIAAHPLWNVTAWNPAPRPVTVTIDPTVALPALCVAAPQLFTDAVGARVVFDAKANAFTAVPGRPGTGIDLDDLAARLGTALATGGRSVSIAPREAVAEPAATTAAAEALAARLNDQAAAAGFYLGDERVEAVPLATVASWVSIAADAKTGDFAISPDRAAVDGAVAGLAARVDRAPQNETVVTNSKGERLRVIQEGHTGVRLAQAGGAGSGGSSAASAAGTADSTTGIADAVAASLSKGELRFALRGELTPFATTTIFRRIEVDKSAGTTRLFEGPASGQETPVASYPVAIGTGGVHETRDGHFTVYAQLTSQDMGDCNGDHGFGYCTKNVPWVSYFDGDQGFHGTYWHHNFGPGARMSHGCVNMRIPDALALYRFAQIGTEVWVHD